MPVWRSVVALALGPVHGPVGAAGRGIYSVFEGVMISGLQKRSIP